MKPATAFRGQPVLVLAALLVGWVGLRAAFWQAPLAETQIVLAQGGATASQWQADRPLGLLPAAMAQWAGNAQVAPFGLPEAPYGSLLARADKKLTSGIATRSRPSSMDDHAPQDANAAPWRDQGVLGHRDGGQLSGARSPRPPAAIPAAPFPVPPFPVSRSGVTPRFSGDSWLLLRKDTTTPVTAGRGSYGQSQVGAVLRYRILPESGHRPAAYARASKALARGGEVEGAVGLSARPLPSIPLTVAAEMRLMEAGGQTYTRPAFYAVTELPVFKLPLRFKSEVYAQAGYVGGEFSTPFVDGQVRVERPIVEVGPVEVSAGGGSWGGAQEGAERLDIGPGATVAVDLGNASARLSVDWRFRVAGEAEPSDGPAMTISAGF